MTAIMERREVGSKSLNQAVREALNDHENRVSTGIAYYGHTTRQREIVARRAIEVNPALSSVDVLGMRAEFHEGHDFWLGAELSGVLFESLARYAVGNSACHGDREVVHGGFSRGVCDCRMRRAAREWASEIATRTLGVEFPDA